MTEAVWFTLVRVIWKGIWTYVYTRTNMYPRLWRLSSRVDGRRVRLDPFNETDSNTLWHTLSIRAALIIILMRCENSITKLYRNCIEYWVRVTICACRFEQHTKRVVILLMVLATSWTTYDDDQHQRKQLSMSCNVPFSSRDFNIRIYQKALPHCSSFVHVTFKF